MCEIEEEGPDGARCDVTEAALGDAAPCQSRAPDQADPDMPDALTASPGSMVGGPSDPLRAAAAPGNAAQARLETSSTSSAALFDLLEGLAGAAGWVFRADTGVILPTPGLLDLLSQDTVSHLDVADLLACVAAPDRLRVLSRLRRTLRSGAPCRCELSLTPAHGGLRLELSAGRYRLASGTALVGVAIDVSERYRLIGDLAFAARRAVATADRAADRTPSPAPIAQAKAALGPAEIDTLAHIAAHDLQGPLRKILFYADLVKRGYPSSPIAQDAARPDDMEGYLETIVRSATRMKEQIGDLAQYAEIAAAPMDRQELLVSELVRSTTSAMDADLARCDAVITRDGDLAISGDPHLLSGALGHLIRNALQSRGDDRPEIRISARRIDAADAHPEWDRITVADNGTGFDPSQADRIFDLFTRLPSAGQRPSTTSSTGVGLAICASVARRHGGRIWAEAEPGAGARFHLDLPTVRPADHPPT